MVPNILTAAPLHDPGDGIKRSKFNLFQNMVIVAYQIKGITKCSNTVANILAADPLPPPPPPPPGDLISRSNSTFSEHGHVAYQIKKENHKCSNSVVNILLSDPSPPTLGVKRSKFNSFRSMSCCISN